MNILMLCTYPIDEPRHGGQIRVKNIAQYYQAAGHQVSVMGVSGSEHYPQSEHFAPYPCLAVLETQLSHSFLMEDVAISLLYEKDDTHYQILSQMLRTQLPQQPDLIHVEQPWLWGFAQRYLSDLKTAKTRPAIQLVYGSQNIECQLKHSILSSYRANENLEPLVEQVRQIELRAMQQADRVLCVSQHDQLWFEQQRIEQQQAEPPGQPPAYPKPPAAPILAPNGVSDWVLQDADIALANKKTQQRQFALFCASAHPPNVQGFFALLGQGFAALSWQQKLVIVGGAGQAIADDPRLQQSARLADKIQPLGMVDSNCLQGLLSTAHCLILPITQGGGTNLKTAEALWAGHHIVATHAAMRGFEAFIGQPGISVSDDPGEFKRLIRSAMQAEPLRLTPEEQQQRRSVLWQNCLKNIL